jgi:hypothetical protein
VLVTFLIVHLRTQPYTYCYQNALEGVMAAGAIVAVTICFIYRSMEVQPRFDLSEVRPAASTHLAGFSTRTRPHPVAASTAAAVAPCRRVGIPLDPGRRRRCWLRCAARCPRAAP